MSLEKIIYITPWESELSELTSVAEYQLKELSDRILNKEIWDSTFVMRTPTSDNWFHCSLSSLLYISNKFKKTSDESSMNIYNLLLHNPWDIDEVKKVAWKAKSVIVWVSQKELTEVMGFLQASWSKGPKLDNKKLRPYNIYALVKNLDKENTVLYEFPYNSWEMCTYTSDDKL